MLSVKRPKDVCATYYMGPSTKHLMSSGLIFLLGAWKESLLFGPIATLLGNY